MIELGGIAEPLTLILFNAATENLLLHAIFLAAHEQQVHPGQGLRVVGWDEGTIAELTIAASIHSSALFLLLLFSLNQRPASARKECRC